MIKFFLICRSKHWPARIKKIDNIIKKILIYEKDLNFKKRFNYNCNIILTDNQLIKKMNFKFRKKNKPTDVLTFVSEINLQKRKKSKICDIFFSAETILNDANNNGISFYNHLTHLFIHSFLHINGHLHNKIKEYNEMSKIEIKILNKIGISNPYLKK